MIVPSQAVGPHLDLLATRVRAVQPVDEASAPAKEQAVYAGVRLLGALLSYYAQRLPIEGQKALVVATTALQAIWATGQQPSEDEHLGAVLTWIDPPAGV